MHKASERKAKTERKISTNMSEWGKGQLHSGSKKGPVVPKTRAGQRQALAISYAQARRGKK